MRRVLCLVVMVILVAAAMTADAKRRALSEVVFSQPVWTDVPGGGNWLEQELANRFKLYASNVFVSTLPVFGNITIGLFETPGLVPLTKEEEADLTKRTIDQVFRIDTIKTEVGPSRQTFVSVIKDMDVGGAKKALISAAIWEALTFLSADEVAEIANKGPDPKSLSSPEETMVKALNVVLQGGTSPSIRKVRGVAV